MSSLQPGGEKRQTRLQHQGGVQLWNGKPHEDKALGRSCSCGDFNLSLGIAQNFTPFRFSAGFILPRRALLRDFYIFTPDSNINSGRFFL